MLGLDRFAELTGDSFELIRCPDCEAATQCPRATRTEEAPAGRRGDYNDHTSTGNRMTTLRPPALPVANVSKGGLDVAQAGCVSHSGAMSRAPLGQPAHRQRKVQRSKSGMTLAVKS